MGTKPKIDVTKAEVDLSQARLNLLKADNALRIARISLNNAMGVPDAPVYEVKDSTAYQDYPIDLATALKRGYDARPDLVSATAKREAAERSIDLARTGYYPVLSGNAGYGWTGQDFPLDKQWTVGAALNFPLFSGFLTRSQVEEARANLDVAKANEENIRQGIRFEVEQAYYNLKDAREGIVLAEVTVEQAKENRELAQGRYAAGVGNSIEVADAVVIGDQFKDRLYQCPVLLPAGHCKPGKGHGGKTMKKVLIGGLIILLVAIGAWYLVKKENGKPQYKTATVQRGDLDAKVTATGTVNAVTTVLIGTQVSGTINALYVDYNSPVIKGQLLAQIDPATIQAQVDQAVASLLNAEANLKKAQASLLDARRTYERNKQLMAKNFIAQSDLDTSETNAQAADAQLDAAKAQVLQGRAALSQAQTNLRYTRIVSPVNGTVISRSIDVGQTVAASFQTPTLFTIAEDLTKMQIDTSVDEADIGKVKVNQDVRFTVDAYPDMNFTGKVSEIRNAPTTVQNVVTYDVIVQVNNAELKLKPGMTANVSIITDSRKGVLFVPNSALRFRPQVEGDVSTNTLKKRATGNKGPAIWILENNKPKQVKITIGISDGSFTEVVSGQLKEGQEVIVSMVGQNNDTQSSRPPRMFH